MTRVSMSEENGLDQVETMSRAMCQADDHDPDLLVGLSDASRTALGDAPTGPVPQWRLYEPQARKLITVQQDLVEGHDLR